MGHGADQGDEDADADDDVDHGEDLARVGGGGSTPWPDDESIPNATVPVRRVEGSPFGYNDRELTKRERDHKQVFDYGCPTEPLMERFNAWPQLDGFKSVMAEFHNSFGQLAHRTVRLLHDALDLSEPGCQAIAGDAARSIVRLNHYPVGDPVPGTERAGLADLGPTALGYHPDPAVLTLLLQDATGGLQTQTRDGEWIDVDPQPGTVVVNLADAMQVWNNDPYFAAIHRVVPMTRERRFSIPFFFNPVKNAVVEPLPEWCTEPARFGLEPTTRTPSGTINRRMVCR